MQFERRLDARLIFSIVAAGILSFTGVVIETAMNVTFPSLMKEFSISTSLGGSPRATSWCWRW